MLQGENYPYKIIRTNHRGASETVAVVMGISAAERAVADCNMRLTPDEKEAGWSCYQERTTQKPDPKQKSRRVVPKPEMLRKR